MIIKEQIRSFNWKLLVKRSILDQNFLFFFLLDSDWALIWCVDETVESLKGRKQSNLLCTENSWPVLLCCHTVKTCVLHAVLFRVLKTLPSFTNVAPNWHPLHAVHMAPCNVCYKNNQRRTMMLDRWESNGYCVFLQS